MSRVGWERDSKTKLRSRRWTCCVCVFSTLVSFRLAKCSSKSVTAWSWRCGSLYTIKSVYSVWRLASSLNSFAIFSAFHVSSISVFLPVLVEHAKRCLWVSRVNQIEHVSPHNRRQIKRIFVIAIFSFWFEGAGKFVSSSISPINDHFGLTFFCWRLHFQEFYVQDKLPSTQFEYHERHCRFSIACLPAKERWIICECFKDAVAIYMRSESQPVLTIYEDAQQRTS